VKRFLSALAGATALAVQAREPAAVAPPVGLQSPSGLIRFEVSVDTSSPLAYSVTMGSDAVIERTSLGIVVDGRNLADGVDVGAAEPYTVDERFLWLGVHATAVARCRGARIQMRHAATAAAWTLDARACDDGVAFRYIVPGGEQGPRIPDEATTVRFPSGSTVWSHGFDGHYEGTHERREVGAVSAGDWVATPLTVRLPRGGYAAVSESALVGYAGMALRADGRRGFAARLAHEAPISYPFFLRYYPDEVARLAQPAAIAGSITTPWRVVAAGRTLNDLVNADIIHALAPPPDRALFPDGVKTSWIRPGRAVWRYLDGGENTFDGIKQFTELAARLGFEHHVVEGIWQRWTGDQLRDLVRHARERNVGIWLWKDSRALATADAQRAFFTLCQNVGAAGAKIDFFDHEAKEMIDRYQSILREAAARQIMVNFHGANKPAGEARTWPNELTREGVQGLEYRSTPDRALHDTTLPFTRYLAGAGDYTPVIFGERRKDTSWAHQIATAAVFTSPLLVFGAHPQSLLDNPAADLIKSLPSVWDETIVLPMSAIGEVAAFARRRGSTWFVAVLNGPTVRTLKIDLGFLGAGRYDAFAVRDALDDPAAVRIEKTKTSREASMTVEMRAAGGFIARFVR
jgi:alpha-glucosidase